MILIFQYPPPAALLCLRGFFTAASGSTLKFQSSLMPVSFPLPDIYPTLPSKPTREGSFSTATIILHLYSCKIFPDRCVSTEQPYYCPPSCLSVCTLKSDHALAQPKTLQWVPIALNVKPKLFMGFASPYLVWPRPTLSPLPLLCFL